MEKVSNTREIDPDFLLQINFEPGITQPQRIFQTAASMIEALHSCDKLLLESFPAKINPIFVLEQIESGSLKVFLKQILEAVSDDALNNMDWKPAIGKYLVKGKYFLLKQLSDGLPPDPEKLVDMSNKIQELARETQVLTLPSYTRISEVAIAKQAVELSDALSHLEKGESVELIGDNEEIKFAQDYHVTKKQVEELLSSQKTKNELNLILKVRRPDFLGESKWEFRFDKRNMTAIMADLDWLSQYQNGQIDVRPGDALEVRLEDNVDYDINGEVVKQEWRILKVIKVMRPPEQIKLL